MLKICNVCFIEKDISEFHKKGKGYQYMCKECRKPYIKNHYLHNKQKYIDKANKQNKELSKIFSILKESLKCEECGEDHPACLEFHHIDPSQKDMCVSRMYKHGRERLMKEIKKCKVLCANCHKKLHFDLRRTVRFESE